MGSIGNIFKIPELRRRILFTVAMLAVYRVGVFVTIPGVNRVEMSHVVTKGGSGSFLGMFNMFSGGALEQFSIFTLGIMPYVTASIVMQLLTVVVPKLDQIKLMNSDIPGIMKTDEANKKKFADLFGG